MPQCVCAGINTYVFAEQTCNICCFSISSQLRVYDVTKHRIEPINKLWLPESTTMILRVEKRDLKERMGSNK